MNLMDIERLVKKIYILRKKKRKLQAEHKLKMEEFDKTIKQDVNLVLKYLDLKEKRKLSIGDYSIEKIPKTSYFADYKRLQELINQERIPDSILKKRKHEILYIKSKDEIKLVGNKFIIK